MPAFKDGKVDEYKVVCSAGSVSGACFPGPRTVCFIQLARLDIRSVFCLSPLCSRLRLTRAQEAAWAISNATSGGKPEQIKYLVQHGCIAPLSDLLEVHDAKIVTVALEGLENILKVRRFCVFAVMMVELHGELLGLTFFGIGMYMKMLECD